MKTRTMRVTILLLVICAGTGSLVQAKEDRNLMADEPTKEDIAGVWMNWGEPSTNFEGDSRMNPVGASTEGIPLSLEAMKEAEAKQFESGKAKRKKSKAESKQETDPAHIDVKEMRDKVLSLGKKLLDLVTGADFGKSGFGIKNFFPADSESRAFRSGRAYSLEGNRGVLDWLARLIGVSGKTLGEFLREYQVHVLYDLVFTFFKWIFFLYAGLLIP